jgi:REP element-mobilizing transposase RayT
MSTYTQIIYQIVFGTKRRERTLTKDNRDELFKYICGLLANKNCHVYRVNGVEDHLHIVTHLHPNVALGALVKDIKLASTHYIKEKKLFKNFAGWQEGYGAFTYTVKEKERLIAYVMNQEEHHRKKSFQKEYIRLLEEHQIDFDKEYWY